MGLRHRSIRLRVGVLITVPVLCLLALYGFVLSITLGSAVSQKHATTLRNDVADPVAAFQQEVAQERGDALLSLADPTDTEMASKLGVQESATQHALAALTAALNGPGVASLAAPPEQAAIRTLLNATKKLSFIRGNISDDAITMRAALADYDAIIDAGYPVIDEALDQLSSVPIVTQALDVINLDRASQATQAEWDLLAADIAQRTFPNADRLTFAALANQRRSLIAAGVPDLDPQYRALLARYVSPASTHAVTAAETRVINTPWHRGVPPARLSSSKMVFADYSLALGNALLHTGDVLQNKDQHNTNTVIIELLLAAGLGLLGTIVSISLSLIIGRGLIRQLRALRESALTLAHDKLPSVISRLRAGDQVDLAEYAPSQASTGNEMEQVQNAFNIVQQTAVKAAVDEARLRRGISDVFRNLAGRSQSLLHRQLTLLDGMERRATEPEELEDLFRIDHLTTRMRRHAEGLIILSGEAPARGWRQPVPLVDVLRAAVAEVEDYTRIRVLCRTSAAVAGHAVADVIHLVAELAENATVFSPPNTPVRIQGDVVGRGFAIEIEDRGLGISAARLEEINANLANPPQFDLSGSDRLGLFIAGQLAQRHDIKITLRPSVFGGTTAIVLIPTELVVDEGTFERDPTLSAGQDDIKLAEGFAGRHAALAQSATGAGNGFALSGRPGNGRPGNSGPGNSRAGNGAHGNSVAGNGAPGNGMAGNEPSANEVASTILTGDIVAKDGGNAPAVSDPAHAGSPDSPSATGPSAAGPAPTGTAAARESRTDGDASGGFPSGGFADDSAARDRFFGSGSGRAGFGSAGSPRAGFGSAGSPRAGSPRAGFDSAGSARAGFDSAGSARAGFDSAGSGRSATGADGPWGNGRAADAEGDGPDYYARGFSLGGRSIPAADATPSAEGSSEPLNRAPASDDAEHAVSKAEVTELGLPVRVRQANLAPQLRNSPPASPSTPGSEAGFGGGRNTRSADGGAGPTGPAAGSGRPETAAAASGSSSPTPATPEAARNVMSALQRGWQMGRSEAAADSTSSVFTPRKSPSGNAFDPYDAETGSSNPEPADSADEHNGE
ncbi:MAG TPA: nitrate- and nitrite sensing domain-containing protein [Streptosporangiaceae bacterium]|nr:nitrate- and nitrite sensing domain-containing protein [Streptosporangiaceae bacterium]